MKSPILITGGARSGTSLIAGIFDICGGFGGETSPPNRHNQKGMFENYKIRNTIIKPYLRKIGVDPKGQFPLPPAELFIPANLRQAVENIMLKDGYSYGEWYYKGAKMCLIWKIWHYHFPKAKWIIVRRKNSDIVNSCLKTGFMTAFCRKHIQEKVGAKNEKEGWLWWIKQHQDRFREMIKAGLNIKEVWTERMIDGDYNQMKEVIKWAGLVWNDKKVKEFIEPKLWKNKNKK